MMGLVNRRSHSQSVNPCHVCRCFGVQLAFSVKGSVSVVSFSFNLSQFHPSIFHSFNSNCWVSLSNFVSSNGTGVSCSTGKQSIILSVGVNKEWMFTIVLLISVFEHVQNDLTNGQAKLSQSGQGTDVGVPAYYAQVSMYPRIAGSALSPRPVDQASG